MSEFQNLVHLAKTTNCKDTLNHLADSQHMIIRRATARNKYTPPYTLEKLAFDTTLNVSVMAIQNPNYNINREFDMTELGICVVCDKDERQMDCSSLLYLDYSINIPSP
jgi:hypothetical protein